MMHWLLILTLTYNGRSVDVPWALTPDANICGLTGVGAVAVMQAEIPGLTARFTCMLEVRA